MASLQYMSTEIVDRILSNVAEGDDNESLTSVALVSKALSKSALVLIYRTIELRFSDTEVVWTKRILNILMHSESGSQYLKYVHNLTVRASDDLSEQNRLWEYNLLMLRLIDLLPRLQSFSWYATKVIPISLLEKLRQKSSVRRLDIQLYKSTQNNLTRRVINSLERMTKLHGSLVELSAANLPNLQGRPKRLDVSLRKAIIEAPHLKTLILRVDPSFSIAGLNRPELYQRQKPERQAPALENLKIIGPSIDCQGILGTITLSHLKILELWNCGNCSPLFDSLISNASEFQLRIFKLRDNPENDDHWLNDAEGVRVCEYFLSSFTGLKELLLEGYGGTDMTCIVHHADTLERLTLIEPRGYRHRSAMLPILATEKAEALRQIRDGCTNLRFLRVNESRKSLRTGSVVADMLASFPTLHDLTIVIDPLSHKASVAFTDYHAWNIARSVASHRLRQLDITDLVHHPTDKTPLRDVKLDAEIRADARNSTVHWRVHISPAGLLQAVDFLRSPHSWQEGELARMAKAVEMAYMPPVPANDMDGKVQRGRWLGTLYRAHELEAES